MGFNRWWKRKWNLLDNLRACMSYSLNTLQGLDVLMFFFFFGFGVQELGLIPRCEVWGGKTV